MKSVECTWGDGPDVILKFEDDFCFIESSIDYSHFQSGSISKGQLDFTADEAIFIAQELLRKAQEAKMLNESYRQSLKDEVLAEPVPQTVLRKLA